MRYQPVLKLAVLALTALFISPTATWATKETPINDFAVDFLPEEPLQPGAVLRVTIRATAVPAPRLPGAKTFEVKYSTIGRIRLLEAPAFRDSLNPGESMEWTMTVLCEPNDIASVRVYFTGGTALVETDGRCYFVSDDTSVTVSKLPPPKPKPKPDPYAGLKSQLQSELKSDSARYQQLENGLRQGVLAQGPPWEGVLWSPTCSDPLPVPPLPNVPILTRAEFYAKQIPATTADAFEVVWVEGGHWARQPGESTFFSVFPSYIEGKWSGDPRGLSSVSHSPSSYVYSMVFYVPLDQSGDILEPVVGTTTYLGRWWQFNLYRGTTTLDQLPSLRAYGIGFWFDACYPTVEDATLRQQLEEGGYLLDTSVTIQRREPAGSPPEGSLPASSDPPPEHWPNLVPWQHPYWSEPVIVRNWDSLSARHSTDLYVGEWFYFGWSEQNVGDTLAGGHSAVFEIYLDGHPHGQWTGVARDICNSLAPGAVYSWRGDWYGCNYACINNDMDTGMYPARLVLDWNGSVAEGPTQAEEDDNIYNTNVHVVYGMLEYSGTLQYVDQSDSDTTPVRGVRIELRDKLVDTTAAGTDTLLGFDTTDQSGHFDFDPVPAIPQHQEISGGCTNKRHIYFRYAAENTAAKVVPDFGQNPFHSDTTKWRFTGRGVWDTTITITGDSAGPYAVADAMLFARDSSARLGFVVAAIPQIEVELDSSAEVTGYSGGTIHINASDDYTQRYPDTYDEYIVCHEYAHYLQDQFGFLHSSPGVSHDWFFRTDSLTAATEGFAHFFACYLHRSARSFDTFPDYFGIPFADTAWRDMETGQGGLNQTTFTQSVGNLSREYEGAVAGVFWDVADDTDDNFYKFYHNHDTALAHRYDNPRPTDSLQDSLDNLSEPMMSCILSTPGSVTQFWQNWISTGKGHLAGMAEVMAEHGIGCVGVRGDVDCNGIVSISDCTALTSCLFGRGYVLRCPAEANVSADALGNISIADLTSLNSCLFQGGVLPTCPCATWEAPPKPPSEDSSDWVASSK